MKTHKNENIMSNDTRIALLENTIGHISETLLRMEANQQAFENKVDSKFDALDRKFESKIDALDHKIDTKIDALDHKIDSKIDALDRKFESKFELLARKIDGLSNRVWVLFLWVITSFAGVLGILAKSFHWF